MRIALISDIHGNLPALEAVLAAIDSDATIDAIYHLGDLVGYAPWPNEVIGVLRERGIAGVAGNYDSTTRRTISTAAAGTKMRARKSCRT